MRRSAELASAYLAGAFSMAALAWLFWRDWTQQLPWGD